MIAISFQKVPICQYAQYVASSLCSARIKLHLAHCTDKKRTVIMKSSTPINRENAVICIYIAS